MVLNQCNIQNTLKKENPWDLTSAKKQYRERPTEERKSTSEEEIEGWLCLPHGHVCVMQSICHAKKNGSTCKKNECHKYGLWDKWI
jgi:hypothetical protein